jgi:sugar phosphate isomerase/epimerase
VAPVREVVIRRGATSEPLAAPAEGRPLAGRLGLDVPREWWPTAPELKRLEACGYDWVQLHAPPVAMLADPLAARRHAECLRAVLAPTGLCVVLHAPDALCAGAREQQRACHGLLDYARIVEAALVVYHAAQLPVAAGAEADRAEDRLLAEECALRRLADRAERIGTTIAVENLAPVYPGPAHFAHAPLFVRDLVRRVGSPALGMVLDLGHAHITSQLMGTALRDVLAAVRDEVVLFHVHDNLGVRHGPGTPPGIPPLRLDLHLPPGRGTLPWRALAPALRSHPAPLLLEIAPAHRPDPLRLATVSAELLTRG